MKAVVMAGGEGSRLRPLTLQCPKPLVPVANRPVMHHILDLLKRHGITQVVVTLHYLADQIVSTFGDGSDLGLEIRYTVEETPLGTAGSVKQAEEWLNDEPFLIISGDSLTDADLDQFIRFHQAHQADATLGLWEVSNPLEYGVVVTDAGGKIQRFLEKPDWTEAFSNTINTGIYCLDPLVFGYMEPNRPYDWSQDIFPRLLSEGMALYGHVIDGYWCDIGSLQAYRQAQLDLLQGKVDLSVPGERIKKNVFIGEDARIDPGAKLKGAVLVGAGAHVKEGAILENTVVGDYGIIDAKAHLCGSTLWSGVYVGEAATLDGSIICRNSSVGRLSVLEEGVIVGEKSQVLAESSLAAEVKVWPNKVVEAGTRLTMSLISGSRWSGSIFEEGAVRGVPNVEITPEYATKLASAYASTLRPGSQILVGRDSHPASRMIKRAVLSGLMSAGIHVLEAHAIPDPISRYLTRTSGAQGGIHIHMSTSHPSLITLDFFDGEGIALSKNAQRKVENLFGREDYRRVDPMQVGQITLVDELGEQYRNGLKRCLDESLLREQRPRVVLDCAHGTISNLAPALLGEMGGRPVSINAYPNPSAEPRTFAEKRSLLEDLSAMVPTLGAEIGALLDEDATALHVVDDKGRVLSEHVLLMVMADLVFRTEPGATLAVPSVAPSQLEAMAAKAGGRVVRTRNSERDLVVSAVEANASFAGDILGRFVVPPFHGAYDGVAALFLLLERLAKADVRVSEVLESLPPAYLSHTLVPCAWERKGEIIRRLGEESRGEDADLTEGVRLKYDDGWLHILPDATVPVFHLYAQANTPQRLQQMMSRYQDRLEAFQHA